MTILRYFVFLLLLSTNALGQKADTRQFPLEQINVNGSQRYSEKAIIAATGLRPGQQTSQAELEQVSAKLGNSGLFLLVQFRFGWGTKGVVATFNVTDSTRLVPIGFENMVWFSSNELASAIKEKLPLFTGVVPLAGDYKDRIANALQQFLNAHNVQGTVTAIPQGRAGEIIAMFYHVEGHDIRTISCDFPGAEHGNQLALSELARYIMASKYEKSYVESALASRLEDIYAADGYLSAHPFAPELTIVSAAPGRTDIALRTKVAEGVQYTFTAVEWSGNTLYSPEQLNKSLNFPSGQAASIAKFRSAMIGVRKMYQRVGYLGIDYQIEPILAPDGTARFKVNLNEGGLYKMGSLKFTGVDPAIGAKASADWQMKGGAAYDPNYPFVFMSRFGKYLPNNRWEWRNLESINDEAHTVNIQIEIEIKK